MSELSPLKIDLSIDSAQFTQSTTSINRKLKGLQSEFKATSSGTEGFEDSLDGLKAKSENLTDQFKLHSKKVEELQRKYKESVKSKGKDAKETENLAIRYNKALDKMNKVESQLNDTNDAIKKQTSKWNKLNNKLSDVSEGFKGVGSKLSGIGGKMSAGVAVATGAVGGLVAKATEATSEINKFSQITGMSKKGFQEWDHVMKSTGYSMEEASGDMAALGERAMDASKGVGEGAELFDELGVKVTDASGKMKSQEQIFNETIKSLQGMEDTTKRNALASALLGTTGEELVPVLNKTNEELDNMKGKAQVISNEDLSKAEKFKEKWNETKATFSNVATQIGIQLMPVVSELAEKWLPKVSSAVQTGIEWFKNLEPATKSLTAVFAGVGAIIPPIIWFIGQMASGIGALTSVFSPIITAIANAGGVLNVLKIGLTALTGPIGIAVAALTGLGTIFVMLYKKNEDFRKKVHSVLASVKTVLQTSFQFIQKIIQKVLATVSKYINEKLTQIRKFWDKNGKQIQEATKNVFEFIGKIISATLDTLQKIFKKIFPILESVVKTAWNVIKSVFDTTLNVILGLVKTFSSLFTGDWQGVLDGLIDIGKSLLGGLIDIFKQLFSGLKDIGAEIKNALVDVFKKLWEGASAYFSDLYDDIKSIWSNVMEFFQGIDLKQIGKDIIGGLLDGITAKAKALYTKASEIANGIKNKIKGALSIHSPSRVMRDEVGKWIPEGIAEGMSKNVGSIIKATDEMSKATIPEALAYDNQGKKVNPNTNGQQSVSNSSYREGDTYNFARMFEGFLKGANINISDPEQLEKLRDMLWDMFQDKLIEGGLKG